MRKTKLTIVDFEDGERGTVAKKCGGLWELRMGFSLQRAGKCDLGTTTTKNWILPIAHTTKKGTISQNPQKGM